MIMELCDGHIVLSRDNKLMRTRCRGLIRGSIARQGKKIS